MRVAHPYEGRIVFCIGSPFLERGARFYRSPKSIHRCVGRGLWDAIRVDFHVRFTVQNKGWDCYGCHLPNVYAPALGMSKMKPYGSIGIAMVYQNRSPIPVRVHDFGPLASHPHEGCTVLGLGSPTLVKVSHSGWRGSWGVGCVRRSV